MSLLLEALKRAERAKKQQNIEEITAALEITDTDSPVAPVPAVPSEKAVAAAVSPLAASDSLTAINDLPSLPTVPDATDLPSHTVDTFAGTENTLEFNLEPFDLPPLETPVHTPKHGNEASMAAPLALDWSAVELSPPKVAAEAEATDSSDIVDVLPQAIPSDLPALPPLVNATPAEEEQAPRSIVTAELPPTPAVPPPEATAPLAPVEQPSATAPSPALASSTPAPEEVRTPSSPVPPTVEAAAPLIPTPPEPKPDSPQTPAAPLGKLDEAREKARRLLGKPAPAKPDPKPASRLTPRQRRLLILGTVSTLCSTGIGLYFWNELNSSPLNSVIAQAPDAANPPETANAAQIPPSVLPPGTTGTAEGIAAAAPVTPPSGATANTTTPATNGAPADPASGVASANGYSGPVITPAPQQPIPGTGSISITRNPPRNDVLDDAVKQGYGAYEQGNLPQARSAYQRALRNDPRNRQAMLGLAAVEEANGNTQAATTLYAQTLALDPKDTVAQAALLNLTAGNSPQAESKLRLLLAEQPNLPFLHFILGNLLASQQRWPEAETAYFQAVTLDGNNPDFAFNLAISLDQLRQAKPAREYYQRALTLAERRPYRFNRQVAQQRLEQLSAP